MCYKTTKISKARAYCKSRNLPYSAIVKEGRKQYVVIPAKGREDQKREFWEGIVSYSLRVKSAIQYGDNAEWQEVF